jgi:hypothetical protein
VPSGGHADVELALPAAAATTPAAAVHVGGVSTAEAPGACN